MQELRPDVHFVVTATTRAMRRGEEEGVDYLFIGTEEFEKARTTSVPRSVGWRQLEAQRGLRG